MVAAILINYAKVQYRISTEAFYFPSILHLLLMPQISAFMRKTTVKHCGTTMKSKIACDNNS